MSTHNKNYYIHYFHIIVSFFLIFLGILLWMLPITHMYVEKWDYALSKLFNGTVHKKNWWSLFWAIMNHDAERTLNIFVMISVHILIILTAPKKLRSPLLWLVILYWLILQLSFLLQYPLYRQMLDVGRLSPYYYIPEIKSLATLYQNSSIKDHDHNSFPSWHAFTGCFWMLYTLHILPPRRKLFAVVIVVIAMTLILGRVIGGAQWPTDIIFSCLSAYFFWSLCFAPPYMLQFIPSSKPKNTTVIT